MTEIHSIGIHFAGDDLSQSRNRLAIACGAVHKNPDGSGNPHPYEDLHAYGKDRWHACELDAADVVVYALPYHEGEATRKTAERAKAAGLPCIFFRSNDDPTPASPPHGVVYRTSLYREHLTPAELAMPAITEDLLAERGGELRLRTKADRAKVGFCGYVGSSWNRLLYRMVGQGDKVTGLVLRQRALRNLRRSQRVDTDIVERTQVWGGAVVGTGQYDEQQKAKVRREFLDNLFDSDYGLCLRGKGNYSFRFYEVFAVGRIPIFIDTSCVLPYESEIDWRRHCVWVDESDIDCTDEIVAQFHADLAADDFAQLQLDNRKLWEEWLRPEAFYTRMLDRALGRV